MKNQPGTGKWKKAAALALALAGIWLLLSADPDPVPVHPYVSGVNKKFWIMAHRGGRKIGPENSLAAFSNALKAGADVLETDVRLTADGKVVLLHDPKVDRTTNGQGEVAQMPLSRVQALDAGYHWSPDSGKTRPFRGKKVVIPTAEQAFAAHPGAFFNMELKDPDPRLAAALCRVIRESNMTRRVMVAAFKTGALKRFRKICPHVATSAGSSEVLAFWALSKVGLSRFFPAKFSALQVPEAVNNIQIITPAFVRAAHEKNLLVHVWTVNDINTMDRLIQTGVDGVMTDRPDLLAARAADKRLRHGREGQGN